MARRDGREWAALVAVTVVLVAGATMVAVAVRDLDPAAWLLPAIITVAASVGGERMRSLGSRQRPEERSGDRVMGWSLHHPWRSALSAALVGGTLFALVVGLASAPDGTTYWRLLPLFLVAAALGDLLGRWVPRRRYQGDDPALPDRWRRRVPDVSPGLQADPRRDRP